MNGTFFWNEISNTISNITLNISPDLITRQRKNLGKTGSRGLELEGELQIRKRMKIAAGYQFADTKILEFPDNPTLEQLRIPQVPAHQVTMQFSYLHPAASVGIQGRFIGEQFEDDLNLLPMERYFTIDAMIGVPVTKSVEFFAAGENLLNDPYTVGRTPVRTLGAPRLIRFGFRLRK
jgi:outer membrane receptor protein involved in Fe transport